MGYHHFVKKNIYLFLNRKTRKSEKKLVFFTFLESVETNGKTDAFEQKSQKIWHFLTEYPYTEYGMYKI